MVALAFIFALAGTILTVFQRTGAGMFGGVNLYWILERFYEAYQRGIDINQFLNNIGQRGQTSGASILVAMIVLLVIAAVFGLIGSISALRGKGSVCLVISSVICFGVFAMLNFGFNAGLSQVMNRPVNSVNIVFIEIALWGALYAAGAGWSYAAGASAENISQE